MVLKWNEYKNMVVFEMFIGGICILILVLVYVNIMYVLKLLVNRNCISMINIYILIIVSW